jgi:hypothetical protein
VPLGGGDEVPGFEPELVPGSVIVHVKVCDDLKTPSKTVAVTV